jgi:hypothetical protein
MGMIKEPADIDFFVDPRPLTEKERQLISEYIRTDRQKRRLPEKKKRGASAQRLAAKKAG